ncbi:TonB family protein [Steroidobacter sp.]|uniref:TonB family protein n=1 Tax=Steroidobacter sp. TaxID=1978227 RepID=UPI001A3733A8|nr:TonB family protein [Steroidobacter sp.]MBL8267334.1 TonB family protein [Steroidobacter sp.]
MVAALIAWLGFSVFKSAPTPPAASIAASPASSTSSAASKPTAETTAAPSIATPPAAARTVAPPPDAPTTAVNEVLPTVSQSSLNTIRGTIRVSVRVTLDKQGSVTNATATDAGPSRYFARLAVNASKQWTFTPATAEAQRTMLVQFNFTRFGITAESNSAG